MDSQTIYMENVKDKAREDYLYNQIAKEFSDPFVEIVSTMPDEDKYNAILDSIDYVKEDYYYNIERFKQALKKLKRHPHYTIALNYLYYNRLFKNWKLGSCIRFLNVFHKYKFDYNNITLNKICELYLQIRNGNNIAPASKCLDWNKLKTLFRFLGYDRGLDRLKIPEPKNNLKEHNLITKEEFLAIYNEFGKHQYGKGLEYQTFWLIIADTGCRTGEVFSITKEKLRPYKNGIHKVIIEGKTGERGILLYHSSENLNRLIEQGWRKWSFDYHTYYRQLRRICKRLKINKRIYNHLLRHTFGSYIALNNEISIEVKNKFCGWSPKSRMLETTYAHFSNDNVFEKIEGVLKENPLLKK